MPRQSKKLPKRPKRAPRMASSGPTSPVDASKPLEAPPVAPPGQESVRSASWPAVLDDAQFNVCWGQLSMRQKQKVREIAEVRGLGLRGVLNLFPGMRSG